MLRPGGYVQLAEYYLNFQSDNGRLHPVNHCLGRWSQMFLRVMDDHLDRDPRIGRKLADKLRAQRFRHVRSRQYHIPIAAWHDGELHVPTLSLISELRFFFWLSIIQVLIVAAHENGA